MKAAVAEYMKTVQANVLKGFRVPVGDQFLTVYPNLNASVKDVKDKEGNVTVATPFICFFYEMGQEWVKNGRRPTRVCPLHAIN